MLCVFVRFYIEYEKTKVNFIQRQNISSKKKNLNFLVLFKYKRKKITKFSFNYIPFISNCCFWIWKQISVSFQNHNDSWRSNVRLKLKMFAIRNNLSALHDQTCETKNLTWKLIGCIFKFFSFPLTFFNYSQSHVLALSWKHWILTEQ